MHNLPSCPVCDHPLEMDHADPPRAFCRMHGYPIGPVSIPPDPMASMTDEEVAQAAKVKKLPGPTTTQGGLFHPDMKAVKARKKHDRIMQNTPVIVNQPNQADLVDSIRDLLIEDRSQRNGSHILPDLHQTKQLGTGNAGSRFCTQCGAPSSSNDRFCAGCGAALQNEIIIEPNQEIDREDEDKDSKKSSTPMF